MMTLTSTQLGQLAAQFFLAGAGTLSFAVLFACPKRTLPYCALVGAVGWFVYELAVLYGADAAAASLIAIIPLSLAARICAVLLKAPVTVFLLTGIFPLVPGAGIYYTAYYFIQGENALSLANGISTFKVAVALAVGIALVLGLPMPHAPFWKRKKITKQHPRCALPMHSRGCCCFSVASRGRLKAPSRPLPPGAPGL